MLELASKFYLRENKSTLELNESIYKQDPYINKILWKDNVVAHPYFGYIDKSKIEEIKNISLGIYSDKYVVAIVGGSVAGRFGEFVKKSEFTKKLKSLIPELKNKDIVIVNLGVFGYKQPQQFQLITSLIEHLNLVINIDGQNEVYGHRGREFFSPEYPLFSSTLFEKKTGSLYFRSILALNYRLIKLINIIPQTFPLISQSSFYYLFYEYFKKIIYYFYSTNEPKYIESIFLNQKPYIEMTEEKKLDTYFSIWKKYHELTTVLAHRYGLKYFSFIQPSQYLSGSKVLSDEEKSVAINQDQIKLSSVKMKLLFDKVNQYNSQSEWPSYNIMNVFLKEKKTVYIDSCCHFNDLGQKIFEKKILEIITTNWRTSL